MAINNLKLYMWLTFVAYNIFLSNNTALDGASQDVAIGMEWWQSRLF